MYRENELLKHQLKKYVGAVQKLRDGPQAYETLAQLEGPKVFYIYYLLFIWRDRRWKREATSTSTITTRPASMRRSSSRSATINEKTKSTLVFRSLKCTENC